MLNPGMGAGNDLHFTDMDVPDPPLDSFRIGFHHVLVRPIPAKPMTKGGIYLPDQTMEVKDILGTIGRVLAIGPTAFTREDMLVNGKPSRWYRVGDHVVYGRHAGVKIKYKGVKLLVLNDDHPFMVIDNPQDFLE